jgi:hypothetical protein
MITLYISITIASISMQASDNYSDKLASPMKEVGPMDSCQTQT